MECQNVLKPTMDREDGEISDSGELPPEKKKSRRAVRNVEQIKDCTGGPFPEAEMERILENCDHKCFWMRSHMSKGEKCLDVWLPKIPHDLRISQMTDSIADLIASGRLPEEMRWVAFSRFAALNSRIVMAEIYVSGKFKIPMDKNVLYDIVLLSRSHDDQVSEMLTRLRYSTDQWDTGEFLKEIAKISSPTSVTEEAVAKSVWSLLGGGMIAEVFDYSRFSVEQLDNSDITPTMKTLFVFDKVHTAGNTDFMAKILELNQKAHVCLFYREHCGNVLELVQSHADLCGIYSFDSHSVLELNSKNKPLCGPKDHFNTFAHAVMYKLRVGEITSVVELFP